VCVCVCVCVCSFFFLNISRPMLLLLALISVSAAAICGRNSPFFETTGILGVNQVNPLATGGSLDATDSCGSGVTGSSPSSCSCASGNPPDEFRDRCRPTGLIKLGTQFYVEDTPGACVTGIRFWLERFQGTSAGSVVGQLWQGTTASSTLVGTTASFLPVSGQTTGQFVTLNFASPIMISTGSSANYMVTYTVPTANENRWAQTAANASPERPGVGPVGGGNIHYVGEGVYRDGGVVSDPPISTFASFYHAEPIVNQCFPTCGNE
jgi:hypothetical protein